MTTPTPHAILDALRDEGVLEIEDGFAPDESLFDAGLDSMALMQLLLVLESTFGITVPPEAVTRERFETAGSLAEFLRNDVPG